MRVVKELTSHFGQMPHLIARVRGIGKPQHLLRRGSAQSDFSTHAMEIEPHGPRQKDKNILGG